MNRDLIILLKYIYKDANDRNHHILKLDEIIAASKQNKLQIKKMMAEEEKDLKDKVSQAQYTYFLFY